MPPSQDQEHAEGSWFDPLVLLFALWTLLANAVVSAGGGLRVLVFAGAGGCLIVVFLMRRFRASAKSPAPRPLDGACSPGVQAWERVFVLAIAVLSLGLFLWRADALLLWVLGLPLTLWCLWRSVALPATAAPAACSQSGRLGLWILALGCLALTLLAHRADFDDSFYINLAVHAADHPDQPLMAKDTMHGIEGLPISLSVYRLQSYELLAGAIAWLGPWEAIECMHVLFPAVISLMIPFGLALLLRRVLARHWLLAVGFGLLFLFAAGDPHRSFGNFSFMRLQQGKSVLLSLILPLVLAYGLRFGELPGWRTWLLLSAAQIAALGVSVSGLWLAPSCAMLALAARLPWSRAGLRTLMLGLTTCVYPLGLGLALSASVSANLDSLGVGVEPSAGLPLLAIGGLLGLVLVGAQLSARAGPLREGFGKLSAVVLALWCLFVTIVQRETSIDWLAGLGVERAGSQLLLDTIGQVLGGRWFAAYFMLLLLGAWALCSNPQARRLWALFGCCLFLLFWNPMLSETLAAKLTGGPTYWRVFWVLPAAALVGCVSASLVGELRSGESHGAGARWAARGTLGLILAAGLVFLPGHSSLSPKNQVFFASPGLRARQVDLGAARTLAHYAGPKTRVLAPIRVSPWIPTMHQHPFPLMVRRPYMRNLEGYLEAADIQERVALTRLVSGSADAPAGGLGDKQIKRLLRGIQAYDLQGLCLASSCVGPRLEAALGSEGLHSVSKNKKYQVWVKS